MIHHKSGYILNEPYSISCFEYKLYTEWFGAIMNKQNWMVSEILYKEGVDVGLRGLPCAALSMVILGERISVQ